MALTKNDIRDILKQEFGSRLDGMEKDLKLIRQVQGHQSLEHAEQRIAVNNVQSAINDVRSSVRGQSVMLEDLESRFTALCEAVDENMTVRSQVRDHETRLTTVESIQSLIQKTVREHSRQLKLLTTNEQ